MRCVALRQRIDEIRLRTNSSKEMISLVTQMNNNCDELLNQSLQSLSDILKSHMKAQEKFEEIKSYISIQRRTNHIFSFCGLIFLLIFLEYSTFILSTDIQAVFIIPCFVVIV